MAQTATHGCLAAPAAAAAAAAASVLCLWGGNAGGADTTPIITSFLILAEQNVQSVLFVTDVIYLISKKAWCDLSIDKKVQSLSIIYLPLPEIA